MRLSQALEDIVNQGGPHDLPFRNVDIHGEVGVQPKPLIPVGDLPARRAKHPLSDLDDQTRLFCDGDEVNGADLALIRVIPTNKRFETQSPARRQFDNRLVYNPELIVLDGVLQTCSAIWSIAARRPDCPLSDRESVDDILSTPSLGSA